MKKKIITSQSHNETLKKAESLVEFNVLCLQDHLIRTCLDKEVFSHDDISNCYEFYDDKGNEIFGEALQKAQQKDNFYDLYYEQQKVIYAWYLVTDWLACELNKKGETILKNECGIWWGRASSGQLIEYDSVIQEITLEHY